MFDGALTTNAIPLNRWEWQQIEPSLRLRLEATVYELVHGDGSGARLNAPQANALSFLEDDMRDDGEAQDIADERYVEGFEAAQEEGEGIVQAFLDKLYDGAFDVETDEEEGETPTLDVSNVISAVENIVREIQKMKAPC